MSRQINVFLPFHQGRGRSQPVEGQQGLQQRCKQSTTTDEKSDGATQTWKRVKKKISGKFIPSAGKDLNSQNPELATTQSHLLNFYLIKTRFNFLAGCSNNMKKCFTLLVNQGLCLSMSLVGRTGGSTSRCTSASRLEWRRATRSGRATGWKSGYSPSEEQPRREMAGSLLQWKT